jgi:hypothetical protein
MSLEQLIDDNRRAIQAEPVKAKAVFRVTGDLVGLTEVDLKARAHTGPASPKSGSRSRRLGPKPPVAIRSWPKP